MMSLQFKTHQKTVTIVIAICIFLSAILLLAGLITYIWDIHEALSACWWEMYDKIPKCYPDTENCEELFRHYEPSCGYSNEQLVTTVICLLLVGGIFAIIALSCYCYSVNLSTPPPKKSCNNRCLWKAWVSLATVGGLFAVYSLAFIIKFSHYPAAKRPPTDSDGLMDALTIMGAFTFLTIGMLMTIIGLILLCCLRTVQSQTDHKEIYEDEALNI